MPSFYRRHRRNRVSRLAAQARSIAQRSGIGRSPTLKRFYRMVVRYWVRLCLMRTNVPIIAVTGTNGKTTTVRLLRRILIDAGYNVGACTTEGVTHNGTLFWKGDASWVYGILKAMRCPNIDILVLETARGGLIRYGAGFRRCQVGIVTNVYEDHLGLDGIDSLAQLVEVKAMVARRVHPNGTIVLNADNDASRRMADRTPAAPIYFTTGDDQPQYDRLFFIREHHIFKRMHRNIEYVMDIRSIATTYGGLVSYNTENALAAFACLEGIRAHFPIQRERIKRSLSDFGVNPGDNFKRFCLLTFGRDQVVLTRSKNPESCRRDMHIVEQLRRNLHFDHVVGIMSGIGNRQARFHKEMSRIAASACDYFFIRPPKVQYLRGKTPGQITRLIGAHIPDHKILSRQQCGLPEVVAMSRKMLGGRILFVVLNINIEERISFQDAVESADSVDRWPFGRADCIKG